MNKFRVARWSHGSRDFDISSLPSLYYLAARSFATLTEQSFQKGMLVGRVILCDTLNVLIDGHVHLGKWSANIRAYTIVCS